MAFGAETLLNQVRKESEKAEIQGTERYKTEMGIYRKINKLTGYEGEAVPELLLTLPCHVGADLYGEARVCSRILDE